VKRRVRHDVAKLTPYERTTATVGLGNGKCGLTSNESQGRVRALFDPFGDQAPDELALGDVLREVLPSGWMSPEETVTAALKDPARGLVLRYDPDPDPDKMPPPVASAPLGR